MTKVRFREDIEHALNAALAAEVAAYAAAGYGLDGDPRVRALPRKDPERLALHRQWQAADEALDALRREAERLPRRPRPTGNLRRLHESLREWGMF